MNVRVPELRIGWETHPWEPDPAAMPLSRRQRAAIRPTYQATVPADIAPLTITTDPGVTAAADDARAEISRFDSELSTLLPDTDIGGLAAVLLRTESASSSQIENITAQAKTIALADVGAARYGSNAKLIASNVDAMNHAISLTAPLSVDAIRSVHELLMHGQHHADPGRFRTRQVWVGGSSASPHGAIFVPPHHSRVRAAIEDLCRFIVRSDVPLLTQCAVTHAQFETIHPFNDGNGRTGRALVHAMLKQGGATTSATVPISAGLLGDPDSYFAALSAYQQGDPNPIVAQFADAAFLAIANGRQLAHDLVAVHKAWTESITARRNAAVWKVLRMLLGRPATTSALVQKATGLSQPAADSVLSQLSAAGILSKAAGDRRYVVWVATDVTQALDAFASRAVRRR